jgi:hypothetical protein
MKKSFRYLAVLMLVIILGFSLVHAANDYQISPQGVNLEKSYELINPYYFVHYTYLCAFEPYRLSSRYDLNTKVEIISKAYFNLSNLHSTKLTVKDYNFGNLIFTFTLFNDKYMKALNLRSNYYLEEKRYLTDADDYKITLIGFDIVGEKLVPASYKYSKDKAEKLKDNLNDLADFYIFDDQADNDSLIEGNLKKYLKTAENPLNLFAGTLTLAQYYTSIRDFANAKATLEKAVQILGDKTIEPNQLPHLKALYTIIDEVYQVTKRIVEKK